MSRHGGVARTRLPDYSIGATVLMVAIGLPFFILTRAEHGSRSQPPTATPTAQRRAVTTTADPTVPPSVSSPPQAVAKASPTPRPSAKRVTVPPASVLASPTAAPTSTPSPLPDSPPVAVLAVTIASGPAPLTVTADASGSSDTDLTPIAQVIFNFGDGTIVNVRAGRSATHTYTKPGVYTLAVAVIDTAQLSSTVTTTVTVT